MKKWGVLGLVILGGLILALQYRINKSEKTVVVPPQPVPADQVGVALPSAATGYQPAGPSNTAAARNYSSISVPTAQSAYPGACPDASLAGILAAHGTNWGHSVPKENVALEFKENEMLYDFLGDYAACVAVARADIGVCDTLPGEPDTEGVKDLREMSLYARCRKKTGGMMSYAYWAGKVSGTGLCNALLAGIPSKMAEKVSHPDFCAAAAKSQAAARDFMYNSLPDKKQQDKIRRALPDSNEPCDGKADCLQRRILYKAIKDGKASACPRAHSPHCEATISRATLPCEAIVKDMSKAYCEAVERIKKKSGGFIGVSRDEMQSRIAQLKARKASEELQKKEDEKLLIEINKKAKKILGKE